MYVYKSHLSAPASEGAPARGERRGAGNSTPRLRSDKQEGEGGERSVAGAPFQSLSSAAAF